GRPGLGFWPSLLALLTDSPLGAGGQSSPGAANGGTSGGASGTGTPGWWTALGNALQGINNAIQPPPLIDVLPFVLGPEGEALDGSTPDFVVSPNGTAFP